MPGLCLYRQSEHHCCINPTCQPCLQPNHVTRSDYNLERTYIMALWNPACIIRGCRQDSIYSNTNIHESLTETHETLLAPASLRSLRFLASQADQSVAPSPPRAFPQHQHTTPPSTGMRLLRFGEPVGLARVSDQMIERREVKRPVFGENWQPRLELLTSAR